MVSTIPAVGQEAISPKTPGRKDNPRVEIDVSSCDLAVKPQTIVSKQETKEFTPHIVDIRQHLFEMDLNNDIMTMLQPERGPKQMPTMLLYDTEGLQIFEEVMLTAPITVFRRH